jgi:hypothetical protein
MERVKERQGGSTYIIIYKMSEKLLYMTITLDPNLYFQSTKLGEGKANFPKCQPNRYSTIRK